MVISGESTLIRIVKRAPAIIVAGCFLVELASNLAPGQATKSASVFKPALDEIRSRTRIPILLPSKLPSAVPESGIELARGEVRGRTAISFRSTTRKMLTPATLLASGGSTVILQDRDLPSSIRVPLSGGRNGIFRAVSCGVSCAPANLWWEQNRVMYQIQIKLRPTLPQQDQQNILVEAANGSVPAT